MSDKKTTIMERFRGVLGNDAVDDILDNAEQATDDLDAAGKERKSVDELVDETPTEAAPEDGVEDGEETNEVDAEAIAAFVDDRIGKALEKFADAVAQETVKALDEERATMQKHIDRLESQIIDIEDDRDAESALMPRAMQNARERASASKATVVDNANAPPAPEQGTFALGTLAVDKPTADR